MNLVQLRTALRTRMGIPTTDALFTDAVCTDLINSALNRTASEADWPWLEKLVTLPTAGAQESYEMPADWLRTITLQQGDYHPLERLSIQELLAMSAATGRPTHFAIASDDFYLRPIPDVVLALRHFYIKQEVALAGDGDTPEMPGVHHYSLVEYAAYLGFRRAKNLTEAGGAKAAYDEWKETLLERLGRDSPSKGGAMMPPAPAEEKRRG